MFWIFTWQFLIGLFVGGSIGIVVMCLCAISSKADRDMQQIMSKDIAI